MEGGKKKLVTHDGSFHADDVFSCASLMMLLDKRGETYEVTRTRDEKLIKGGDYVFDVGGVHIPEENRFDHHQIGGAGKHENGMEYAAFGLVWKKFGEELCGTKEIAKIIEEKLVSPIDAADNGINFVEYTTEVKPYLVQSVFNVFYPSWKNLNDASLLASFLECVEMAKKILKQEIAHSKDAVEARDTVISIFQKTSDKRIIILDKKYPYEDTLSNFPEPIFVIYPRTDGGWAVKAERVDNKSFKNKKDFPAMWAGLRDEDLANVSGVRDAIFCHRARFLAVAKTKEGAIELAKKALEL